MPEPTPATATLLRALRDEVRQNNPAGRIALAIDGTDGAGQAAFADALAAVLAEDGSAVFRASIDGFQRPRTERHARGPASPEGVYLDSYDYAAFRRVLIEPFRSGGRTADTTTFQLEAFDVAGNVAVEAPAMTAPKNAVLIVDGVFLNRPELRGIWNFSLWLDMPDAVMFTPYLEAHQLYLREARPLTAASVIVDNTDPANPTRVYRDFC